MGVGAGLYMFVVVVQKFTFAISSPDEFLLSNVNVHVRYMLSPVRLSFVCLSSVTLVHPTQAVEIFGNTSMALGTLAIR